MRHTPNKPMKIIIYGDGERFTENSIGEAIKTIRALMQEGKVTIEIENVTAKIEDIDKHDILTRGTEGIHEYRERLMNRTPGEPN